VAQKQLNLLQLAARRAALRWAGLADVYGLILIFSSARDAIGLNDVHTMTQPPLAPAQQQRLVQASKTSRRGKVNVINPKIPEKRSSVQHSEIWLILFLTRLVFGDTFAAVESTRMGSPP
jgi:hypothetical protein